jgi:HSP20 family protein
MDRLFVGFGREVGWPAAATGAAMAPSVNVSETESELKIEVDLPGVDEKDVELVISDHILTIKGEKKTEKEEKKKDFHLVEWSYGSFSRSPPLPFAADPNQAKATFRNGVLSISLPQAARDQRQGEEDRDQRRVIVREGIAAPPWGGHRGAPRFLDGSAPAERLSRPARSACIR